MAENTLINLAQVVGGDTIAADELTTLNGASSSGVKIQRNKVCFGDDADARDASTAYPLPVKAFLSAVAAIAGNGAVTTGVQRVTIASDSTGQVKLAAGTAEIGKLAAGAAVIGVVGEMRASTLMVTATAAVNTALTLTLPAPAAGLFQYITDIEVVKLYADTGTPSAAGALITTTNLPGDPVWTTEQIAGAIGTVVRVVKLTPTTPLKAAVAATAVTIVCPQQLETIWRVNVTYFTAV